MSPIRETAVVSATTNYVLGKRDAGAVPKTSVQPASKPFPARAESRTQVDASYKAAMAAGGRDNGAPGIRAHYHPNYYGAFVLDPDGHNIEAVCHHPA